MLISLHKQATTTPKIRAATFPTRLDSSAMTNEECFQIGMDDGLYQVSIAGDGMFEPTRALQGWWYRNDQG